VDLDIIQTNPFLTVKIQRKLLISPLKKDAKSQVYDSSELEILLREAYKDFEETDDTSSLAIVLCAKTGIRIGECMGLKASDLYDGYLHIRREEVLDSPLLPDGNFGPREYIVVDHCKTDAGLRDIPAIGEVTEVIKTVRKANLARTNDSDFLFLKKDGSKMHS
jgi:integrase